MWIVKLMAAIETIKGVWSGVTTIAGAHPELATDIEATFYGVLGAMQHRDAAGIWALVDEVKTAFTDFTKAYTGEAGALADLLAKLKSIAN